MKAVVVTNSGINIEEIQKPVPKPNEVLIRVRASSLNRADIIAIDGHAHTGHMGVNMVPGLEWAGEIERCGLEVPAHLRPGDRVMATGHGSYAEYAVADWGRTIPIPDAKMTLEEACALPLALMTMHDAIVTNGKLVPGETMLIHAATSGVGLLGLQVAKLMGAGTIIGTCRRAERQDFLKKFGATAVLDNTDPNWPEQAIELTKGKGVDLAIDLVSGGVINETMKAAAVLGRIVNVGRLGGFKGEFDYDLHALKRLTYVGVTFRTRSIDEVRTIVHKMQADLWKAVSAGDLRLPIDRVFTLDQVKDAVAHMRTGSHVGKIVMKV